MQKRISDHYRPQVDRIAEIYVAQARNKTSTAKRVRGELGLSSFKADTLRRWLETEEFGAAVAIAEEIAADRERVKPSVRGPRKIAWLLEIERGLKVRHGDPKNSAEKEKMLAALLKVGAEIRAEETHFESMQVSRAKRNFAGFIRNLIKYIARRHKSVYPVVAPVLKAALRSMDEITKGSRV